MSFPDAIFLAGVCMFAMEKIPGSYFALFVAWAFWGSVCEVLRKANKEQK